METALGNRTQPRDRSRVARFAAGGARQDPVTVAAPSYTRRMVVSNLMHHLHMDSIAFAGSDPHTEGGFRSRITPLSRRKTVYDIAVVGLGIAGSSTVYQASRRNLKVIGLEQFGSVIHAMGSSHGKTRIIRQAYFEHPDYVPLVLDAYREWDALEQTIGERLLIPTGGVMMGRPETDVVTGSRLAAQQHGLPFEELSAAEVRERFPGFRITDDEVAIYEPQAGYLRVEPGLQALIREAQRHGAEIQFNQVVEDVQLQGDHVVLTTPTGTFAARQVILTVGAWLTRWAPALPLEVERQVPMWFRPEEHHNLDSLPIYIREHPRNGRQAYGFPYIEGQGIKAGVHHQGQISPLDQVNRQVTAQDIEQLMETLDFIPRIHADSLQEALVCLYTNTPDSHFVVGRVPQNPGVIIAGGFSGHGYKFGPTVGSLVTDMALGTQPGPALFHPARFR